MWTHKNFTSKILFDQEIETEPLNKLVRNSGWFSFFFASLRWADRPDFDVPTGPTSIAG